MGERKKNAMKFQNNILSLIALLPAFHPESLFPVSINHCGYLVKAIGICIYFKKTATPYTLMLVNVIWPKTVSSYLYTTKYTRFESLIIERVHLILQLLFKHLMDYLKVPRPTAIYVCKCLIYPSSRSIGLSLSSMLHNQGSITAHYFVQLH